MKFRSSMTGASLRGLVLPFALLIVAQASLAVFSSYSLSVVRAYVRGEGLWSKGAQDAIYFLSRYASTGAIADYQRFQRAIDVPLGDLDARNALSRSVPDLRAAHDGFVRGGNDLDDIPGLIWMFRNFSEIRYFRRSITLWKETDPSIRELVDLGRRFHGTMKGPNPVAGDVRDRFRNDIYNISMRLTPRATAFSVSLSDGSRQLANELITLNIATAMLLTLLMVWHTRRLVAQGQSFELALREEKERAQVTLASIGEAVISVDAAGLVEYANPAAETLVGEIAAGIIGEPIGKLLDIADRGDNAESDGSETENPSQLLVRHDGTTVPISIRRSPIGPEGRNAGAVYVIHNRTVEENLITRLSWQATHDALTGLANRRMFEKRLDAALHIAETSEKTHCLMFIDIDQFKVVNDTNGHAAGDQLLRRAALILQRELRKGDILARMGGDEFAILAEDCDIDTSFQLAERLRNAMEISSFHWGDRTFNITTSIGVVPFGDVKTTAQEALRAADAACYIAKENGRNRVEMHRANDRALLDRFGEMGWVQKVRQAIEQDRFLLYAQEISSLTQDEPGWRVEVLLRMLGENGEIVSPDSFIPAAERYGLMPMVDRWVVREAFRIIKTHLDHPAAPALKSCAINLSGMSFGDFGFVEYIRAQLDHFDIPPEMIAFEVTETSAITNLSAACQFMKELRNLGCRFSLDDFGSGMSSLLYLKQLPIDSIKIDGAFVRDMLTDPFDRAIVEMVGHVGKLLGIATIAEYVENDDTLEALREIGIDYAQGYAIEKPKPFRIHNGAISLQSRALA